VLAGELLESSRYTHCLALATLLIEQLSRLRHSKADEFVLATRSLLATTAVEHLECLHGRGSADVIRGSLVVAILLVAIKLLVLLDRVVFVDVFILNLVLVASEQTERRAEQVRVA
jgi:hypothetical protein